MDTASSRFRHLVVVALLCQFAPSLFAGEVSFRKHVAPILLSRCVSCHNEDQSEGGYNLASFSSLKQVGDSESVPVKAGAPNASELLRRLTTSNEDERMPAESDALPLQEIEAIRQWIKQGAKYDATDESASLSSILPVTRHPSPPATYRFPLPISAVANIRNQLLVGGYHEVLRIDRAGKLLQRIPQVGERVYDLKFDRERDRIYVASGTPGKLGEVRILDATSGELVGVPIVSNEIMLGLAIHSNQKLLAVAGGDRRIYIFNLDKNAIKKTYDSHSDWVRAVRWSDDGSRLASASRDKTVKLFDLSKDQPLDTYAGLEADVMDVMFLPGKTDELIACDAEGKVHRWRIAAKKPHKFSIEANATFGLAASNDGIWIGSRSGRGEEAKDFITKFDWPGKKKLESQALPGRGVSIRADLNPSHTDPRKNVCVGLNGQVYLSDHGQTALGVLPMDPERLTSRGN